MSFPLGGSSTVTGAAYADAAADGTRRRRARISLYAWRRGRIRVTTDDAARAPLQTVAANEITGEFFMQVASAVIQDEIEETFERLDGNGDRLISFEEFAELRLEMDRTRTRAALRREFDAIDKHRAGHVSFEEFFAWVAPHGAL